MKNPFEYCLVSIGHDEKPKSRDLLVISSTIGKPEALKIIDIYEDYFLLDTKTETREFYIKNM